MGGLGNGRAHIVAGGGGGGISAKKKKFRMTPYGIRNVSTPQCFVYWLFQLLHTLWPQ